MIRFAPSPTGDMHIGNLRVAIFNYIVSLQENKKLFIRIEDTDHSRNVKGKDKEILQILDTFKIEYFNLSYQSDNLNYHRKIASNLLNQNSAFNCFCDKEILDKKKEIAKNQKRAFRYDGTCLRLSNEEVLNMQKPSVIRIKKPRDKIRVKDIIKGEVEFSPFDVDDFIILKDDKKPTYNYACSVDDMLTDISLVIRGEDHFSNSAKQIHIRKVLNYDKEILYAHLPIILNKDGKKMSKRDNSSSVKWLLNEGFLPQAIANYLIALGNKTPKDIFSIKESIEWFNLALISKAPAKFDMNMLRFINKEHIKLLSDNELSNLVGYKDKDVNIGSLCKLYLEECDTIKEIKIKIDTIFSKKTDGELRINLDTLRNVIYGFETISDYDSFKKALIDNSGLKGKELFKSLRFLITGFHSGPDISKLYPIIKNNIKEIIK